MLVAKSQSSCLSLPKSWDYRLGSMNEQTLHMGTNADGRLVWLMCPTWRLLKVNLILLYSSFSKSLTRGHDNLFQPVPSSGLERHNNYRKAKWTGAHPGHVRNLNLFIIWIWVFAFKNQNMKDQNVLGGGVDRQVTGLLLMWLCLAVSFKKLHFFPPRFLWTGNLTVGFCTS